MSLPPDLTAAEFLKRFFDHLKPADLRDSPDKTLQGLYNYFIDANRQEIKQADKTLPKKYEPTARQMSLFEVYIAYLNREQQVDREIRAKEFLRLMEDIKRTDLEIKADAILEKRKTAADFNAEKETLPYYVALIEQEVIRRQAAQPSDNGGQPSRGSDQPSSSATTSSSTTIKMSKKLGLRVISEAIRLSYVKKEAQDHEIKEIECSYKTHQEQADIVRQETATAFQAAGIEMPKPVEDPQFHKRNDLMQCFMTTSKRIEKLLDLEAGQVLRHGYLFDASPLVGSQLRALCPDYDFRTACRAAPTELPTVEISENCGTKQIVHLAGRLTPTMTPLLQCSGGRGQVQILEQHPLQHMYSIRNRAALYVMASNQLNMGNSAYQGIDSQIEAPVYYATTYSAALEPNAPAFPVSVAHVIYMPYVLFVKQPVMPYDIITGAASGRIRILCCPSPYRPAVTATVQDTVRIVPGKNRSTRADQHLAEHLNIADSTTATQPVGAAPERVQVSVSNSASYNAALQMPQTRYSEPDRQMANIIAGLSAAYALGAREIVLDDRGIDDYWLPAYHTAEIVMRAVRFMRLAFDSITICVPKRAYADIYRQHCG